MNSQHFQKKQNDRKEDWMCFEHFDEQCRKKD